MVGLLHRCAPHRHQLVADVVHQHALMIRHTVRQRSHHVVDPIERAGGADFFGDAAEAPNIAKQHTDVGVAPVQHVGMRFQVLGQFRRKELLELQTQATGRVFALQPRQSRGHGAGHQFQQQGVQLGNVCQLVGLFGIDQRALAIQNSADVSIAVQNWRRHHRMHRPQTLAGVLNAAPRFPESLRMLHDLIQNIAADRRDIGFVGSGLLDHLPGRTMAQQDAPRIEPHQLDRGAAGPRIEIGRVGRHLKDIHRQLDGPDQVEVARTFMVERLLNLEVVEIKKRYPWPQSDLGQAVKGLGR